MTNKTLTLVVVLAICTVMSGLMAEQFTAVFAMGNATQVGNQSGNQNESSAAKTSTSATTSGATVIISSGSSSPSNAKFFDPPKLTVSKGTTVTWKNADSTIHTVISGSAQGESGKIFKSGYINSGKTFQHIFSDAGTFDYYCTLHPYMKGQVVVN
ncbi:MAG TPA: plastocyanin/azurin family copper-binding protein [Nitrososphaeraceae archaeon]|nr:plastocyanin/azurin family copper-binding protein [Nitrososphaeraceae archaeon]